MPEPLQPFVAAIVRTLRHEKGWSQEELALKVRIEPSEISLLESGKRNPTLWTIQRLAWALEVDLFQLLWLAQVLQRRVKRERDSG
ncbi:MAG: helix-turn-helix domain-containing protein [Solirubrobacterales bacterium]